MSAETRLVVGELEPDTTVIVPTKTTNNIKKGHLYRDCPYLTRANGTAEKDAVVLFDDTEVCSHCEDKYLSPDGACSVRGCGSTRGVTEIHGKRVCPGHVDYIKKQHNLNRGRFDG